MSDDTRRNRSTEPSIEEVREYVGLWLAWYDADRRRHQHSMESRRRAQMIAMAEIMLFLDGKSNTRDDLRGRGLVPLTMDDLPQWAGGPSSPDQPLPCSECGGARSVSSGWPPHPCATCNGTGKQPRQDDEEKA